MMMTRWAWIPRFRIPSDSKHFLFSIISQVCLPRFPGTGIPFVQAKSCFMCRQVRDLLLL